MCGIAGFVSLSGHPVARRVASLNAMSSLIAHRGPDGSGKWSDDAGSVGLVHRRLAIIDLSPTGAQPMHVLFSDAGVKPEAPVHAEICSLMERI